MAKISRLSKHILDASWGEMRRQLIYKANHSQHCRVFIADPYFPSTQRCSTCGRKPEKKLKLQIRKWTCTHCFTTHERDWNAAINLEQLARACFEQYPIVNDTYAMATHAYNPPIVDLV